MVVAGIGATAGGAGASRSEVAGGVDGAVGASGTATRGGATRGAARAGASTT